ncbi:MAG: hypothetical protein ACRCYU_07315 [Nocardioides sp.]
MPVRSAHIITLGSRSARWVVSRDARPTGRMVAVAVAVYKISVRPEDGPHITRRADGAALQRAAPAQRSKLVRGPSFGCGERRARQRAPWGPS